MNVRKLAEALRLAADALEADEEHEADTPILVDAFQRVPYCGGVYFALDGEWLKIGVSKDVYRRLRNHRGSNLRLLPLAVIRGDEKTEERIHAFFAHAGLRIKATREWYEFDRQKFEECLSKEHVVWRHS